MWRNDHESERTTHWSRTALPGEGGEVMEEVVGERRSLPHHGGGGDGDLCFSPGSECSGNWCQSALHCQHSQGSPPWQQKRRRSWPSRYRTPTYLRRRRRRFRSTDDGAEPSLNWNSWDKLKFTRYNILWWFEDVPHGTTSKQTVSKQVVIIWGAYC